MKNRIIWFFREQRSGSSWLSLELRKQLNRDNFFIDESMYSQVLSGGGPLPQCWRQIVGEEWTNAHSKTVTYIKTRPQERDDYSRILNTHLFEGLENMGSYESPILLRQIRKNKIEQLISAYVANKITKIMNVKTEQDVEQYPTIQPFKIPIGYVGWFKNHYGTMNQLWNKYAPQYENETITYENLLEGIESKHFGYLKMNQTCGNTLKLPYDKRELVTNYEEIEYLLRDFSY